MAQAKSPQPPKRTRTRSRVVLLLSVFFVGLTTALPAHAADLSVNGFLRTLADLAFSVAGTLSSLIVALIDLIVPILLYNGFTTSPVVNAGWAIVRDTVNMFFVVILIIIAFGTIFGTSRFRWQQQVPRLMLYAIVINFSKTLCGIMIDFSQVIMLTFANALRQIAAGNFIQLLGLNEIYAASATSSTLKSLAEGQTASFEAFDYFAGGVVAVALTIWVLATIAILVGILLYRIVMLWVMIVLAPLAWFMGGVSGPAPIVHSNAYAQWWDRFKCLVMIGPVLTFFLWLTLAVAGAGNIATQARFDVGTSNNADFIIQALEPQRFMSFLIGMAMLFAGFEAASTTCSSMSGGFIGKAIKAAKQGTLQKAAAALAVKGAVKGTKAGIQGTTALASFARNNLPVGEWASGRGLGTSRRSRGDIIGYLGDKSGIDFIKKRTDAYRDAQREEYATDVRQRKDDMKGVSRDQLAERAAGLADSNPDGLGATTSSINELLAMTLKAMDDGELEKRMVENGALGNVFDKYGGKFEERFGHDEEMMSKWAKFKKRNADLSGSTDELKTEADFKGLREGAMVDAEVQERAKKVAYAGDKGKADNMLDAAQKGYLGKDLAIAAGGGKAALFERMSGEELTRQTPADLAKFGSPEAAATAMMALIESGQLKKAAALKNQLTGQLTGASTNQERWDAESRISEVQRRLDMAASDSKAPGHKDASQMAVDLKGATETALASHAPRGSSSAQPVPMPQLDKLVEQMAQLGRTFDPEQLARVISGMSSNQAQSANNELKTTIESLRKSIETQKNDEGSTLARELKDLTGQLDGLQSAIRRRVIQENKRAQKRLGEINREMNNPTTGAERIKKLEEEKKRILKERKQDVALAMSENSEAKKLKVEITSKKKAQDALSKEDQAEMAAMMEGFSKSLETLHRAEELQAELQKQLDRRAA